MSEKRIAPCGIDCSICDMYVATKTNSDQMRQEIAEKWTKLFHYNFQKDDINCDGCLSGGKLGMYCQTMCEIKPCAIGRGVTNCEDCSDYECDKLKKNRKESESYVQ